MTHKTTMPEPVGYQWLDTGHFRKKVPADADASAFRSLITTTQAEAYADARVREALEEAESIVRSNADASSSMAKEMLHSNADAILALIPPTK